MLNPYRGLRDVRSEMEQVFDDMFNLARRPRQSREQITEWAPAMDVLSRDGDLVVRAELPGMKQEDVDITIQNGVMTISGEQKSEQEEERGGYYMRERRRGSFRRSLTLPENVDESKVRARFQNGVLEVNIEGAAAIKEPKRVEIEGGEEEDSEG